MRRQSPPDARTEAAPGTCSETRDRELARLIPVWPAQIADRSASGRRALVALLQRALRAERQRGLSGHWSYDLARHAQLLASLRAEEEALTAMERGRSDGRAGA